MKKFLTMLLLLFPAMSAFAGTTQEQPSAESSGEETIFYRIRLDADIDKAAERLVSKGLEKAREAGADYIILDLDTYGGAVDAADSIRSAILQCPVPVIAYVNLQAASAGALISIACDSIYMKPGSSIGAATVVNQTGDVMPDKYQSFMRGMMRSTAQATGRDPEIAESMVDTVNVLSLTPEEAVEAGYCEGICSDIDAVAAMVLGGGSVSGTPAGEDGARDIPGYRIENMKLSWVEKLVQILLNPFLQSIFLMMIIGGIYVEIRTPGIGLPLATAVLGALLYFAPLYAENLAQNWEILLFVIGLILVGLEIFVFPGFGVSGITGIVAIVLALAFAMVDNDLLFNMEGEFDITPVLMPIGIVIVSAFVGLTGGVLLVKRLYTTRSFDYIALRKSLDEKDGYVGVQTVDEDMKGRLAKVFSDMMPSGRVICDGRIYEATMTYGFAVKGETVRVVRTGQGRLYCEKIA
ncbi:MAG: nodulation protein NfeD [Bacteroidetes bacterium]|uniref:Nodulation protein NfeD n=1 Tax=Candidatus Cryptobacteroides merdavium TaxID=2840769 RepID=A0A9D9ECN2_9BACT|nr:nodulation protein NfeD [Candidatus Cryptobacteroides merdavium]